MSWLYLKHLLKTFRDDERGSFTVESVIAFPLLFWTICASYEFFEVHRYKSVREKATYTIADLLSREQSVVTDTYMDNVKILFDEISNDSGTNQVRVTIDQHRLGNIGHVDAIGGNHRDRNFLAHPLCHAGKGAPWHHGGDGRYLRFVPGEVG